ncbi:hypothetical protein BDR26DRAFT_720654 [Obelidium mucronatum]|nr:hypothetical protein BDR26DRAFT_720654 [Obelidium mucronatum]
MAADPSLAQSSGSSSKSKKERKDKSADKGRDKPDVKPDDKPEDSAAALARKDAALQSVLGELARLQPLEARVAALTAELAGAQTAAEAAAAAQAAADARAAELAAAAETAAAQAAAGTAAAAADRELLRKLRVDVQKLKDAAAAKDAALVQLGAELDRAKNIMSSEIEKVNQEKRNLATAYNRSELDKEEMVSEYAQMKAERDELAADVEKRKKKLKKKEKEIDDLSEAKKSLKQDLKSAKAKVAKYKVEKDLATKLQAELDELRAAKELVDHQLARALKDAEKAKASSQKKEVKIKHIETKNKIQIDDKLRAMKERVTASIDETIQLLLSNNVEENADPNKHVELLAPAHNA